jgi:hypothetical protein
MASVEQERECIISPLMETWLRRRTGKAETQFPAHTFGSILSAEILLGPVESLI